GRRVGRESGRGRTRFGMWPPCMPAAGTTGWPCRSARCGRRGGRWTRRSPTPTATCPPRPLGPAHLRGAGVPDERGVRNRANASQVPQNSITDGLLEELDVQGGCVPLGRDAAFARVPIADAAVVLPEGHIQLPVEVGLDLA